MQKYELLRAFCLGVVLSTDARASSLEQDEMSLVTKMLKEIASGDRTLYESPDDESLRHLTNVVVRDERELAAKIVNEMGPEVEISR